MGSLSSVYDALLSTSGTVGNVPALRGSFVVRAIERATDRALEEVKTWMAGWNRDSSQPLDERFEAHLNGVLEPGEDDDDDLSPWRRHCIEVHRDFEAGDGVEGAELARALGHQHGLALTAFEIGLAPIGTARVEDQELDRGRRLRWWLVTDTRHGTQSGIGCDRVIYPIDEHDDMTRADLGQVGYSEGARRLVKGEVMCLWFLLEQLQEFRWWNTPGPEGVLREAAYICKSGEVRISDIVIIGGVRHEVRASLIFDVNRGPRTVVWLASEPADQVLGLQ